MMTGKKLIIVRIENVYPFHEHTLLADARAEAARLARTVGGTFVVYTPLLIVAPTPATTETIVAPSAVMDAMREPDNSPDDLPF